MTRAKLLRRPLGKPALLARVRRLPERYPFRAGMLAGVVVTIAVAFLIVQNGESVRIDWLIFHFQAKLWLVLLVTLVAGAVMWEAAKAALRRGRRRTETRESSERPTSSG